MTNPLKGEVDITLGDTTYKTRLNIDSLVKVETELGCGIIQLAQKISAADIRIKELAIILRYALRGGGNDVDNKQVFKLIEDNGIVAISAVVAGLITKTLSDPQEESEGKEEAVA
tara:strand:- start:186 stop:530 length:345 start_codon:yes stop_codon:yes gene_type:complete